MCVGNQYMFQVCPLTMCKGDEECGLAGHGMHNACEMKCVRRMCVSCLGAGRSLPASVASSLGGCIEFESGWVHTTGPSVPAQLTRRRRVSTRRSRWRVSHSSHSGTWVASHWINEFRAARGAHGSRGLTPIQGNDAVSHRIAILYTMDAVLTTLHDVAGL